MKKGTASSGGFFDAEGHLTFMIRHDKDQFSCTQSIHDFINGHGGHDGGKEAKNDRINITEHKTA